METRPKRKSSKKVLEDETPEKKKKMTNKESDILVEAYEYHKGDWRLILEDPKVIALNRDKNHLQNHIEYKRKKKNQKISPNKGNSLRKEIVEDIDKYLDENDTIDEVASTFESEKEEITTQTQISTTPPLSPNSQKLHEIDKDNLSDSISSNDISIKGTREFMNTIKSKGKVRNARIQKKEEEKKDLIQDIREQRREKNESNDFRLMMMQMMIQNQQQQYQQQLQFQQEQTKQQQQYQQQQQQYQQQLLQYQQQQSNIQNLIMMKLLDKKDDKKDDKQKDLWLFISFLTQQNDIIQKQSQEIQKNFENIIYEYNLSQNMFQYNKNLQNQIFNYILFDSLFDDDEIDYPFSLQMKAFYSNYGRGKLGILKKNRRIFSQKDIFTTFVQFNQFEKYLHITQKEFLFVIEELKEEETLLNIKSNIKMNFKNKILIGLYFVIQYPKNQFLSQLWEVSDGYISRILDEILPILANYFIQYVYDGKSSSKSVLHPNIKFITDTTIHKTRKPQCKQRLDYNGNYSMHGKLTQLLIDYDGYISGFLTFIPGRTGDALTAMYNKLFPKILQSNYALGDPGFNAVSYIVPGFRPSQVKTNSEKVFDKISRKEQVLIENVNKFIKDCKSIDKNTAFIHGQDKLLACICIATGLYNFKRELGYFQE